jgi:Flp pilus assembly protein TadD
MVYYFMGKASRKKQSSSQAGKPAGWLADKLESEKAGRPTSEQADKLTGLQANKQASQQAGKPANRQALHILIIFVMGFLAYSNTLQSPFQWDESDFIVGNPVVRDLGYFAGTSGTEGLPVIEGFKSRYIGYLTFALNYKLHGFNVFGYHVVNLAIHLINAILVYFLVLLTFRTPYFRGPGAGDQGLGISNQGRPVPSHQPRVRSFCALAVALLFVAHPIQTEAVTYVFQRFASLVSMFYLMSLVLYIKGRLASEQADKLSSWQAGKLASYSLSLLFAILAMKTKENAFTLPIIITLYEFLFFSGPVKTRLLRLAPFLLTMLIIPAAILGAGATAGEIIGEIKDPTSLGYEEISGKEYLFTQLRVIATYIRLLFFPVNQNLIYDYPIYRSFFTPPVLSSFVFLAAIFGIAVYLIYKTQRTISYQRSEEDSQQYAVSSDDSTTRQFDNSTFHDSQFTIHYSRLIAFGILWFFITLSVESGIIPIPMVMDEYRIYLPSVGFFISLVAGVVLLLKQSSRFTIDNLRFAKVAGVMFAFIILGLASATYARNTLWKNKVSLWEDVVRKSPNSPRAYNNLGLAYNEKGLQEKAIEMYRRSIALNPKFSLAYSNLGVAYAGVGRTSMAIENFEKAVALNPKNVTAYANLARAYGESGQLDKAVENYSRAIALKPFDGAAYQGLGTAYVMLGRLDEAIAAYNKFIDLSPKDPEAFRSRGIVYAKKGDSRSAMEDFERSCSLGSRESCEYLKSGQ